MFRDIAAPLLPAAGLRGEGKAVIRLLVQSKIALFQPLNLLHRTRPPKGPRHGPPPRQCRFLFPSPKPNCKIPDSSGPAPDLRIAYAYQPKGPWKTWSTKVSGSGSSISGQAADTARRSVAVRTRPSQPICSM